MRECLRLAGVLWSILNESFLQSISVPPIHEPTGKRGRPRSPVVRLRKLDHFFDGAVFTGASPGASTKKVVPINRGLFELAFPPFPITQRQDVVSRCEFRTLSIVTFVRPCQTMAVNASVPLDFAFKADDVRLVTTQIMAVATALCGVEDRGPAMKGALSLSHRLALLKSTLQDTSPDLGTLDFVPLSGGEAVCFVVCVFFLFPGYRVFCQ